MFWFVAFRYVNLLKSFAFHFLFLCSPSLTKTECGFTVSLTHPSTHPKIWVVDSNDDSKFVESGSELQTLLADPKLKGVPLLILANKSDLFTAKDADTVVSFELSLLERSNPDLHGPTGSRVCLLSMMYFAGGAQVGT